MPVFHCGAALTFNEQKKKVLGELQGLNRPANPHNTSIVCHERREHGVLAGDGGVLCAGSAHPPRDP